MQANEFPEFQHRRTGL